MDEAKFLVLFAKSAFIASNSLSDLFGFLWKLIHLDFSLKRPGQQRFKQMLRLALGIALRARRHARVNPNSVSEKSICTIRLGACRYCPFTRKGMIRVARTTETVALTRQASLLPSRTGAPPRLQLKVIHRDLNPHLVGVVDVPARFLEGRVDQLFAGSGFCWAGHLLCSW